MGAPLVTVLAAVAQVGDEGLSAGWGGGEVLLKMEGVQLRLQFEKYKWKVYELPENN